LGLSRDCRVNQGGFDGRRGGKGGILMAQKVLLVTGAQPVKNLGGPGKFVPMLMEAFYASEHASEPSSGMQLHALMGNRLYRDSQFNWGEPAQNKSLKVWVKKLLRPLFYHLYVAARMRLDYIHFKQKKFLELVIKQGEYSVVHCHDYLTTVFSGHICKKSLTPLIFTNHYKGSLYREAIAPMYPYFRTAKWERYFRRVEEQAIRVADVLTFPSESARDLLIEDFPECGDLIYEKGKIIYTGIPDPQNLLNVMVFENVQKPNLFVVNVANHIPDKGVDIALHVFKEIRDAVDMDLYFINFGQQTIQTQKLLLLARKLGIYNRVVFKGVCSHAEVLDNIKSAFVCLHTPKKVVFDLSLLEIMALGVPVIATRVKGNEEALGQEYPLFISMEEPRISQEQIETAFERREMVGRALRRRYEENFTISKMLSDYIKLWNIVTRYK
jgi:glycosyltransferase involved in cell wall biosynthesis